MRDLNYVDKRKVNMEYKHLGNTKIKVSRICFGSLTVGPVQANLPLELGAEVFAYGIENGINFFDTAQLYETYPYIKRAMEITKKNDIVISTKTYAYTKELAKTAVDQALTELKRDYIDIFMLHEQESIHTLRGHMEALEYLMECKQNGIIRAVGLSTHHIAAVTGAIKLGLDVIHPILNISGLGIVDGTRQEMEIAIQESHQKGIGIFSMKALGGGNLFKKAKDCLDYVKNLDYIDSIAIGMQSIDEVKANVNYFQTGYFTKRESEILNEKTRKIHIDDWCIGCNKCVKRCDQNALSVFNGRAVCNSDKCILCGYCSTVCKEWAIKIV